MKPTKSIFLDFKSKEISNAEAKAVLGGHKVGPKCPPLFCPPPPKG